MLARGRFRLGAPSGHDEKWLLSCRVTIVSRLDFLTDTPCRTGASAKKRWSKWHLSLGPSACKADLVPLDHDLIGLKTAAVERLRLQSQIKLSEVPGGRPAKGRGSVDEMQIPELDLLSTLVAFVVYSICGGECLVKMHFFSIMLHCRKKRFAEPIDALYVGMLPRRLIACPDPSQVQRWERRRGIKRCMPFNICWLLGMVV